MKFKIFTAIFFSVITTLSVAQDDLSKIVLQKIKAVNPNIVYSIDFYSLTKDQTLASLNAQNFICPASITKLVVAEVALEKWGGSTRFETPVFIRGTRVKSRIEGDLVFRGVGDPSITSEIIWKLVNDIKLLGIKEITGSITIDNSYFDTEMRDESREFGENQTRNAYDAPISAFAINFNTATVAASRYQGQVYASLDPFKLQNYPLTLNALKSKDTRMQVIRKKNGQKDVLTVTHLPLVDQKIFRQWRSISNPQVFAKQMIEAFLEDSGIKVHNKPTSAKTKLGLEPLAVMIGEPLNEIIRGMNWYSSNFTADMLLKKIATEINSVDPINKNLLDVGASFLTRVIKEHFKSENAGDLKLLNASGLSPENRLSAFLFRSLYIYMYKRAGLYADFLSTLPTLGKDGTLEKRGLNYPKLLGNIRAKTGSLTEPQLVSSLSGLMDHPKFGHVVFTIMLNSPRALKAINMDRLKSLEEELLNMVYNY